MSKDSEGLGKELKVEILLGSWYSGKCFTGFHSPNSNIRGGLELSPLTEEKIEAWRNPVIRSRSHCSQTAERREDSFFQRVLGHLHIQKAC